MLLLQKYALQDQTRAVSAEGPVLGLIDIAFPEEARLESFHAVYNNSPYNFQRKIDKVNRRKMGNHPTDNTSGNGNELRLDNLRCGIV